MAAIVHAKNWTWNSSRKKKNHTKSFQGTQWRTPHPAAGRQGGAFPAAAPKPGQPWTPFLCWPESLDQGPGAADTWACQLFTGCEEQDQLALKQVCVALLWSHKVSCCGRNLWVFLQLPSRDSTPGFDSCALCILSPLCNNSLLYSSRGPLSLQHKAPVTQSLVSARDEKAVDKMNYPYTSLIKNHWFF